MTKSSLHQHGADDLTFGQAIALLKRGQRVTRAAWGDSGRWVVLVEGWRGIPLEPGSAYYDAGLRRVDIDPHLDIHAAPGEMQPGWTPSQADILAGDWRAVDD